jgi:hypothetical protein
VVFKNGARLEIISFSFYYVVLEPAWRREDVHLVNLSCTICKCAQVSGSSVKATPATSGDIFKVDWFPFDADDCAQIQV